MAAEDGRADGNRKSFDIYWTRDESVYNSDSETERKSFAPGVDQPIKKKRDTRRMKPAREIVESRRSDHQGRSKVRDAAPNKPIISNSSRYIGKLEAKTPTKAIFQHKDKPSLKDLCSEDKKRVANLIKELAKVGEEKEVIVQQLSVERRTYEERVKKLHQQLTAIIQERELTQNQYLECQKLLAEYQSQLATEQEKVATSLRVSSSPLRFNLNPQPATLQKVDDVPMAKDQSFTQPSTSQQRAATIANQQVVGQKATQMHPDRMSRAPHQNGYQYPKAHPESSTWYPVPIPQSAREGWKQPLGAQPPLQPGTQRLHPSSTQLPPSDSEFNPLRASTHRPQSGKEHRDAQEARFRDKSNYAVYQNTTQHRSNTHQYEVRHQGFSYPGDGHEMVEPRDNSGEFRPLEPEMDFENEIEYYPDASSWNHNRGFGPPSSTVPRRTSEEVINADFSLGNARSHLQTPGAPKPTHQNHPELHRTLLEKQQQQLRKEQAWLQQKLHEQEMSVFEKQRQLAAHRLNPLEREWHYNHPLEQEQQLQNHQGWQTPVLDPQTNSPDIEWEEPNILNNFCQKISSGSENDIDSDAVSTNFPPDGFRNHTPANHLLEDSLRRLNLDQKKHKNRNAHRSNQENFRRYASLYPESNSRNRRQGSTSSASPSTLSSPNSQPALVDRSTSPLYHESGTATTRSQGQGSRPGVSPGSRVRIAPAPKNGSFVTLQDHRSMAKRAVSLPSRPGPYRDTSVTMKSNVTHLSDIIAQMESPTQGATTHTRTVNTSYNTGPARQGYPTTPDLFNEDQSAYTDTDAEQQETKILEDVFFL